MQPIQRIKFWTGLGKYLHIHIWDPSLQLMLFCLQDFSCQAKHWEVSDADPFHVETFLPIECSLGLKGCRQQIFPIWRTHLAGKENNMERGAVLNSQGRRIAVDIKQEASNYVEVTLHVPVLISVKSCKSLNRSSQTGRLEEESQIKQKWYSEEGEGFWGMAAAASPFCHRFICGQMFQMLEPPTLPRLPVATITNTFFLSLSFWSHASKEMSFKS